MVNEMTGVESHDQENGYERNARSMKCDENSVVGRRVHIVGGDASWRLQ